MKGLLALIFAALAAPVGALQGTRDDTQANVVVVWYEDRITLADHCHKLGAWPGYTLQIVRRQAVPGCSVFFRDRGECHVHVLRPQAVDDQRTLVFGHEVLHCFLGKYH